MCVRRTLVVAVQAKPLLAGAIDEDGAQVHARDANRIRTVLDYGGKHPQLRFRLLAVSNVLCDGGNIFCFARFLIRNHKAGAVQWKFLSGPKISSQRLKGKFLLCQERGNERVFRQMTLASGAK